MPSVANSNAATKQEIRDVCAMTVFSTFVEGDSSPSVIGGGSFKASNTNPTSITFFDDGYEGQRIRVVFLNNNTTIAFSQSFLLGNGEVDWNPTTGDSLEAVFDGIFWWGIITSATGAYLAKDADDTSTGQLSLTVDKAASAALIGTNTSTTIYSSGLLGISNAPSTNGVHGTSTGQGSFGVQGTTSGTFGTGVEGLSTGEDGYGILGKADNALGHGFGVYGVTNAETGRGLTSVALHTTGVNYALRVLTKSINGFGAYIENDALTSITRIGTATALINSTVGLVELFNVDNSGVLVAAGGVNALTSATTVVDVAASAAPTVGQSLIATSSTAATWRALGLVTNNGADFATTPVATADNAIALGNAAEAADISDIAIGTGAYASGEGSLAAGWGAIAIATDTIGANTAVGTDAYALGSSGATALGYGSTAEAKNSIAIGEIVADVENEIRIGFEGVNNVTLSSTGAHSLVGSAAMYKLPTYTVATVPAVSVSGMIYVSDGAAGLPVAAFSDGTSWLRCDTLAAVAIA